MKKHSVLLLIVSMMLVFAPAAFADDYEGDDDLANVKCWPGGVLTGFDAKGMPVCECLPPFTPVPNGVDRTTPDYWSVENASINGGPNTATVEPGSTFTVSVDYNHLVIPACPACIIQFQLGFSHLDPAPCIVERGFAPLSGSGSTTFTAPMEPGVYYIDVTRTLELSCLDYWKWAQYHVAAICVKGPVKMMDDDDDDDDDDYDDD